MKWSLDESDLDGLFLERDVNWNVYIHCFEKGQIIPLFPFAKKTKKKEKKTSVACYSVEKMLRMSNVIDLTRKYE